MYFYTVYTDSPSVILDLPQPQLIDQLADNSLLQMRFIKY